jgi:hypothetical protein
MTTLEAQREKLRALMATSEALSAAAHGACLDFMHRELEIAHTFLDLAANAREHEARNRRYARAAEAADEVERYLASSTPVALLDEERDLLARELSRVRSRMTAFG